MPATVVIDAATRDKLLAAGTPEVELRDENGELVGQFVRRAVEVRDSTGKLVGRFVPPPDAPPAPNGYVLDDEWPSDEEIDRRVREDKTYSAAEVQAFLMGLKRATQ